jgi:ribokinase
VKAAVVVVGSFNLDQVWKVERHPVVGETRMGRYASGPGGKGFNQAVAAARSGAATRFITALGQDPAADLARRLATADGIDLAAEIHAELPSGSAGIYVDAAGRNLIVVAPGANAALSTAWIESQAESVATARVLLAQLEVSPDAVLAALRQARAAGVRTVLNPAPADAPTTPALLAEADLITPNETEFAALVERHLDEELDPEVVAATDDAALHDLCRRLHPAGSVLVTLGAAGCFVSHPQAGAMRDDEAHYRLPAPTARAVDTTGAGDAFNGALCAALAAGASSLREAAVYASRYAALSVERAGAAVSMPQRAEVEERFGRGE